MQKRTVSSQTGHLKIGTIDEVQAWKQKKLLTPPKRIKDFELSQRNKKSLKKFRVLLIINFFLSLTLVIISIVYTTQFDTCVLIIFGAITSFSNKLYFLIMAAGSFTLSLLGIFCSIYRKKIYITMFVKVTFLLLLSSVLLSGWLSCLKKYLIKSRLLPADICTAEEVKCWDMLQEKFQCCGWNNSSDWSNVPTSCCDYNIDGHVAGCAGSYIHTHYTYKNGCFSAINHYVRILTITISTIIIIVAIIFLISLYFAITII